MKLILYLLIIYICSTLRAQETGCKDSLSGNCSNEECQDLDSNCAKWAEEGQCTKDPTRMIVQCPLSCNACPYAEEEVVLKPYEESDIILGPQYDSNDDEEPSNKEGEDVAEEDEFNEELLQKKIGKYGKIQKVKDKHRMKLLKVMRRSIEYMEMLEESPFADMFLPKCKNRSDLCAYWTAKRLCFEKSRFMAENCGPMCGGCQLIDRTLSDSKTAEDEQIDDIPFDELIKKSRDYGEEQLIDGDEEPLTELMFRSSLKYYKRLPKQYQSRCRNNESQCAFWAAVGECFDNPIFMLEDCSLSCRACHVHPETFLQGFEGTSITTL